MATLSHRYAAGWTVKAAEREALLQRLQAARTATTMSAPNGVRASPTTRHTPRVKLFSRLGSRSRLSPALGPGSVSPRKRVRLGSLGDVSAVGSDAGVGSTGRHTPALRPSLRPQKSLPPEWSDRRTRARAPSVTSTPQTPGPAGPTPADEVGGMPDLQLGRAALTPAASKPRTLHGGASGDKDMLSDTMQRMQQWDTVSVWCGRNYPAFDVLINVHVVAD